MGVVTLKIAQALLCSNDRRLALQQKRRESDVRGKWWLRHVAIQDGGWELSGEVVEVASNSSLRHGNILRLKV